MSSIDLNSDVGESFGHWKLGDDATLLSLISSANIACGFHAGDARTMRTTVHTAVENGVVIGAHVSYRDLAGFGRRFMDVEANELRDEVVYQIGALEAIARAEGGRVAYVKPHGTLGNTIFHDEGQAGAVVEAMREYDPTLPLLSTTGALALRMADDAGIPAVGEAFADRAYNADGSLLSRKLPGAVLHDAEEITQRVVAMLVDGSIEAIDGTRVPFDAQSICLHGDTPDAVEIARRVRAALDAARIPIAGFVSPTASA